MEAISPRNEYLPVEAQLGSTPAIERAKKLEELAKRYDDDKELDACDACLRAAYNAWLETNVGELELFSAVERVLAKLGLFHKENTTAAASLRFFEQCSHIEETILKKYGGLGNPQTLIYLSEALSACRRPEEAVDVAKRGIDLLFRKHSKLPGFPKSVSQGELQCYGAAWQALAMAEEGMIRLCSSEEEKCLRAVEVLVHYRRGVKCGKELLGTEDVETSNMERRYNAAKKTLAKLAGAAPKDQMPPIVAAYPGDSSAPPPVVEPLVAAPKPLSPDSSKARPTQRKQSATSSRSYLSADASSSRDRSVSGNSKSPMGSSPRQAVAQARAMSAVTAVVNLQRRATTSRLDPLPLVANGSPNIKRTSLSIDSGSPRRPSVSVDREASTGESSPSFSSETKASAKLPPVLLTSSYRKGLQLVFFIAEKRKRTYNGLRSVYLHVREMNISFPHFTFAGEKTLFENIKANDHRLDAMEFGAGHTKIEAATAQRVRRRKSIDEIKKKKQESEEVVLYADMDKRTQRNARRYNLMMQTLKVFVQGMNKSCMRFFFQKWIAFLGPRRRMRPLRRAAAHLFKQIDRTILRRRFITWIRWLKDRKRSVFVYSRKRSTVANEQVQRTLRLIQEQEIENSVSREKDKRMKEEEDTYARHRARLEEMQQQILEVLDKDDTPEPQEEPPKISIEQFVNDSVSILMNEIHDASESHAEIAAADVCKSKFVAALNNYADSEDFQKEVRRLPCSEELRSRLTEILSPLMVSLVEDEDYHSDENLNTVRVLLRLLYQWVDFHRIFFEEDVLISAARSGHDVYVEALLDSVPGFVVSSSGTYLSDLLSICVRHETRAVQLMEVLLMKCEGALPFHEAPQVVNSLLLQFFDRWVPSVARSLGRRQSLYDPTTESSVRARISNMFERVLLDVRSFRFPHEQELADKQTLLSRMCITGDLELVELYCSLIDERLTEVLLRRRQSDGFNCLTNAVKSKNTSLVRYLLTDHEDAVKDLLLERYDQQTICDIARLRGCGEDMMSLLRSHGAVDQEEASMSGAASPSRPSSQGSRANMNIFEKVDDASADDLDALADSGDGELDDIDHLFDDKVESASPTSSGGHISFSSPQPPESDRHDSFRRTGL